MNLNLNVQIHDPDQIKKNIVHRGNCDWNIASHSKVTFNMVLCPAVNGYLHLEYG